MSCVKIISIVVAFVTPIVENKRELTCDSLKHEVFQEGNLGQTGVLSWLGVIRAHIHVGGDMEIAVTGAILIKPTHALANADDMAKIRKTGDSKAMFISRDRGTWTCKLSDVMLHHEYEFATYSTVAVVELDTESLTSTAPMLPICLPPYLYNASDQLYALGFTDENKLLEKVAYKVTYIERDLCDEFYERAGRAKGMYTPVRYECAFAENNLRNCEWENGMALASNNSGYWILVGISVQGPGCSAPARFIELYPYLHWIEATTSTGDFNADYPFRVKVRRFDQSDSMDIHVNRTNYLKTEKKPFNITFLEFLKEYKSLHRTKRLEIGNKQDNVTSNQFLNHSIVLNSTKYMKRETQDSVPSDKFQNQDRPMNGTKV